MESVECIMGLWSTAVWNKYHSIITAIEAQIKENACKAIAETTYCNENKEELLAVGNYFKWKGFDVTCAVCAGNFKLFHQIKILLPMPKGTALEFSDFQELEELEDL